MATRAPVPAGVVEETGTTPGTPAAWEVGAGYWVAGTRLTVGEVPGGVWKVTMGAVTVVAIVVTEPGHAVQGAVVLSVMVVTGTVGAGVTGGAAVEATPAADEDGASEVGAATG